MQPVSKHCLPSSLRGRVAAALLGAATLAGCGSMGDGDTHAMLGNISSILTSLVDAKGQYDAAKRGQSAPQASSQQTAQAQSSAYRLNCLSNMGHCTQNNCGQPVVYNVRFANGASTQLMVGAGQCMPVVGGAAVFACRAGDRFDPNQSACVR
jgi:hypothetical protein